MIMKKTLITLAAAAAFAFSLTPLVSAADYVGNNNSMKFHYVDCRLGKKIRADHRVDFDTRDEAIDAGYTPCQVCNP